MLFVKKLREGGEGEFEVIALDPSLFTVEGLLNDMYQANGWAPATEEEYNAQMEASQEPLPQEEVSGEEVVEEAI